MYNLLIVYFICPYKRKWILNFIFISFVPICPCIVMSRAKTFLPRNGCAKVYQYEYQYDLTAALMHII